MGAFLEIRSGGPALGEARGTRRRAGGMGGTAPARGRRRIRGDRARRPHAADRCAAGSGDGHGGGGSGRGGTAAVACAAPPRRAVPPSRRSPQQRGTAVCSRRARGSEVPGGAAEADRRPPSGRPRKPRSPRGARCPRGSVARSGCGGATRVGSPRAERAKATSGASTPGRVDARQIHVQPAVQRWGAHLTMSSRRMGKESLRPREIPSSAVPDQHGGRPAGTGPEHGGPGQSTAAGPEHGGPDRRCPAGHRAGRPSAAVVPAGRRGRRARSSGAAPGHPESQRGQARLASARRRSDMASPPTWINGGARRIVPRGEAVTPAVLFSVCP